MAAAKVVDDEPVSASVFVYNALGLVTSEAQSLFGATAKTVGYGYDQYGFRTSTTYPDETTTITRTNTPTGQIDTLSRGQTQLAAYDYLGTHTARRTYNTTTPVEADYSYDHLGRLTGIDAGAAVDFGYAYVANENNIWKKTFGHRSGSPYNEYSYDDIDRLTGVTYLDSNTEGFVMDDLGNRDGDQILRDDGTVNFAVDTETNRYTSVGGHNLSYDDAGNLTTDKDGYQFTYDYENRMTEIKDVNDVLVAEFDYDTQGRRIRVYDAAAGSTTLYYYSDNWQVLAEYDGSNVLQAYYVYGNYIDEVLVRSVIPAQAGIQGDYYYLHDHLYSPVALTDSSSSVVERYEYDAYGNAHIMDASFDARTSSNYGNTFYLTGRGLDVFDGGTYMAYDYRYRTYGPKIGRMYQRDPLGVDPALKGQYSVQNQYFDGMNIYEYVTSDPIRKVDPFGLYCHGRFIPARGKIRAHVGSYLGGKARSDVTIDFKPDSETSKHCEEIGFVQIEKMHLITTLDISYNSWQIDDAIPYSNSIHWMKGTRRPWAELADAPGFYSFTSLLQYLTQDFETCAICLKGCEKGANYGCVKWGHSFDEGKNPSGKDDFLVFRYASNEIGVDWLYYSGSPNVDLVFTGGNAPSKVFHDLVDKELIKALGIGGK